MSRSGGVFSVHPVLDAASSVRSVLKSVSSVNPAFMTMHEKAEALVELTAAQAQLDEVRLRVLAAACDVAAATADRDVASWLARTARVRFEDARADVRLADALDARYPALVLGLASGEVSTPQARVVARCLDDLPREVPPEVVAAAEAHLVGLCDRFGPRALGHLGRRILGVVAPQVAEAAEAAALARLEEAGHRRTRLRMRRCGDGTTRISVLVPDAVGTRLATYLHAFTNPRQHADQVREDFADSGADAIDRLPYPRKLGEAFCALLETLDPTRLPIHGGDATTIVVTIPLEKLQADLATGALPGASTIPGEDVATTDGLTAAQVRRLACGAHVVPAVLGGDSELLDLGRRQRLFTRAQRLALLLRDQRCRAEGCEIPGTWCEAHHWLPWGQSGPTDLTNGILLCSHHHHRVHDPAQGSERLPNGDVRFHARR